MADGTRPDGTRPDGDRADSARRLFRYISGEEWRDYRAILDVFAGTFFAEFAADEVADRLAAADNDVDPAVVPARLEQLTAWGNLTTSAAVGNPASLADYYRRRNRYLITRAGQEVHALVEGVLDRVDEVRDVSTSRLRQLHDALVSITGPGPTDVVAAIERHTPAALADAVRAVFDPHVAFTSEITQFFAAINQWQSRYDLSVEEFRFFADVLIGYVSERLDEIQRLSRPISGLLVAIVPHAPLLVERAVDGLAARVDAVGLGGTIAVSRGAGSTVDDWENLARWFVAGPHGPSRLDRLRTDAIAAIRTLTLNLTRLSATGLGATSRRGDLLRLAAAFDACASGADAHRLAAAAFGLYASSHYGRLATDDANPVATTTPWADAPRALVPVSIREHGNTTNRGATTPIRDRRAERLLLQQRRDEERAAQARVDAELLALPALDGATVSAAGLARLQQLLGMTTYRKPDPGTGHRSRSDGRVRCTVTRAAGASTTVHAPHGSLTLHGLEIQLAADAEPAGVR